MLEGHFGEEFWVWEVSLGWTHAGLKVTSVSVRVYIVNKGFVV